MRSILLACLFALWGSIALAHSPLKETTPANGAVVAAAPSEITLTFKGKIRLTRVSVAHESSATVDLDLGTQKGFISHYTLPMTTTARGSYSVTWRGLGSDGHALKGSFSYKVK